MGPCGEAPSALLPADKLPGTSTSFAALWGDTALKGSQAAGEKKIFKEHQLLWSAISAGLMVQIILPFSCFHKAGST